MPDRRLISIPDLARLLGVSRITIYNRVRRGEIEAEKVGRTYVVTDETVNSLLSKQPTAKEKKQMDAAVKRTVQEYGGVLKRLAGKQGE